MREFHYCPMCRTALVTVTRGGAPRRACPAPSCGFVAWNNPAPVVAAIVEHADRVVLVRSHGWPAGAFGLVAGFLESGESPEEAVLREVAEELGIETANADFLGMYPFAARNQLIFAFHIEAPHLEITLCEEELAAYRVVPIEQLVPWSRGTGPALRDWLRTRGHERDMVEFGQHMRHLDD